MYTQVSNCYYHPERGSVATCARCGVGICRECAVKDEQGVVLCYQCGNEFLRQEHREYRKRLKENGGRFRRGREFILPGIIGLLIVAAVGAMDYFGIVDIPWSDGLGIPSLFLLAYTLFSIPFCYIALNDLLAPKYDTMSGRFNKWYFKLAISTCFGWAVFTFFWIRFIITKLLSKIRSQKNKT